MMARRILPALVVLGVAVAAVVVFRGDQADPPPETMAPPVVTTTSVAAGASTVPASAAPVTTLPDSTTSATAIAPASPQAPPPPPVAHLVSGFEGAGLVTVASGGADAVRTRGGRAVARIREGVVMGARRMIDGWIEVVTPCDKKAWVAADEVQAEPPASTLQLGPGADFGAAVLVIDPGHGGPHNRGAPSPDGQIIEKEINLDIALRVRDLLTVPHFVNWETGSIHDGNTVPAAARVVVTRSGEGDDADYEAGLIFRAELASALNAHALVSIHNNAGFETTNESAASDVYYQSDIAESRRLAALLVVEFSRSFAPFDADWVATEPVGAKSRLSPRDGTTQYYGLLRRAGVPAVIAEGAYIANPSEADLLATPEFRQAYADAVYRALVRFITTDDRGGVSYDPVVWEGHAGSGGARPQCVLPEQPAG